MVFLTFASFISVKYGEKHLYSKCAMITYRKLSIIIFRDDLQIYKWIIEVV